MTKTIERYICCSCSDAIDDLLEVFKQVEVVATADGDVVVIDDVVHKILYIDCGDEDDHGRSCSFA